MLFVDAVRPASRVARSLEEGAEACDLGLGLLPESSFLLEARQEPCLCLRIPQAQVPPVGLEMQPRHLTGQSAVARTDPAVDAAAEAIALEARRQIIPVGI